MEAVWNVEFYINGGQTIKKVSKFKYLGRIITNNDDNLPAVTFNLVKAQATWGRTGEIIKRKTNTNCDINDLFR